MLTQPQLSSLVFLSACECYPLSWHAGASLLLVTVIPGLANHE